MPQNPAPSASGADEEPYTAVMTVANIREPVEGDHVVVVFLESARFYRLEKDNPEFESTLASLRNALESSRPLVVHLPAIDSDRIIKVSEVGD